MKTLFAFGCAVLAGVVTWICGFGLMSAPAIVDWTGWVALVIWRRISG